MPERKQHIIRIKGKDRDGSDLDEVWADVRRVDEITILDRGNGQEIIRQFAWDDGFSPDQPDVAREVTTIKLTDPENPPDDPDDPDVYIPLDVVNTLSVMDADQRIILEFANDPNEPTTRDVTVKRVTFAETIPTEIPDPIDATEYERDQSTVDDSQYIDVEVINSYQYNDADQRVENELEQDDELLNQFEVAPDAVRPIRLDPLQNIVNVQWQQPLQVALNWVSGSDGEGTSPETRFYKTLFGEPDRSGSDGEFTSNIIPGFTVKTPSASDPTDAQTAAVLALFDLDPSYNAGTSQMGRRSYFAGTGPNSSKFYSIEPDGTVNVLADISKFTSAIPDNMVSVVEAGFSLVQLVAVPGALFFSWQRQGSWPYTVPEDPPRDSAATLFAVSYVGIDLRGNVIAQETITGPLISFFDPAAGVSFTSAHSPSLQSGKFE